MQNAALITVYLLKMGFIAIFLLKLKLSPAHILIN
jgi:hypothetical protein